jgi:hypothetical protein
VGSAPSRLVNARSAWITLACSAAALLSVVIAARGPARREQAQVSWPATDTSAEPLALDRDGELWYTPLLVSSHSAESLVVSIPCAPAASTGPVLVFATVRRPEEAPGLAMTMRDATLEIKTGANLLTAAPWPEARDCRGRLHIDDFGWQLSRGDQVLATGVVPAPVVSGFYTEIDPSGDDVVRAELTTRPFASRPSTRQWAFGAAAVGLGGLAAWRSSRRRAAAPGIGRPRRRAEDVVVVGALVAWWIVGPWYYDDGWLMATVRSHRSSGSFNNYFDTWATQMPLGFAHHMILTPFAKADASFLLWRIVPLTACIGTWLLLRIAYALLAGDNGPRSGIVALAAGHLTFSFAWLMTLRPEPMVAFLSAVVGVGCLVYSRAFSRTALSIAVAAAAVAATMHPSGLVAGAPLVVAIPRLLRDARRSLAHSAEVAAVMLIGATIAVGLLFADTDIDLWRTNSSVFAADDFHSHGVTDEVMRYRDLLANGTVPAVASVLFGALALGLLTARVVSRRGRVQRCDSAGFALLVAAALLTITPSKWIYHFGSAAAVASLAIAIETARMSERTEPIARRTRRPRAWHGAAVVVLVALIAGRSLASTADAQYFMQQGTRHIPAGIARATLLAAALGALAVAHFARDRERMNETVARWAIPVGLVVVAATSAILLAVVPAVDGPQWSIARRGIPDALGRGCSLADRIDVSDPLALRTLRPEGSSDSQLAATDARIIHPPLPEVDDVPVYSTDLDGVAATGTLRTPWFELETLDHDHDVVLAVKGRTNHDGNELVAEWAQRGLERAPIGRTLVRIDREPERVNGASWMGWRVIRLSRLAPVPAAADLVRLVAHDRGTGPGGYVAFSAPFIVPHARLSTYLDEQTVLVSPPQLPVLACASPPQLDDGLAAMPDVAIGFLYNESVDEIGEIGSWTGPWYLAADAYRVRRVWAWLTDTDAVMVLQLDDDASLGREIAATIRHIRS